MTNKKSALKADFLIVALSLVDSNQIMKEMKKWHRLRKGLDPILIEDFLENWKKVGNKQIQILHKIYMKA
jgi:hypothetical protein